MDVSEYLPMFLAEAREHLQGLNLAVVRVEEDPADRETVDEIFRAAHSLKGMSATMGFSGVAALTHEMENVFELLRQRKGGLEREAIDVLLECLDALEAAVDAIDAEGAENLDPAALIAQLQRLIRDRDADEEEAAGAAAGPSAAPIEADGPVVVVKATLAEDAMMPAVRAFQVLAALGEHGRVLRSTPPRSSPSSSGSSASATRRRTSISRRSRCAPARRRPSRT
jgi:two-component system chemotaxis sensor kinase CheA